MKAEIIAELTRMYQHYGQTSKEITREMIETNARTASSYPLSLVRRVVDKFTLGQIPGQSMEFPPKPPLFAKALREEPYAPQEQQAKREEVRARLNAAALPKPNDEWRPPTQAEKDRVAELLAQFRASTQAVRDEERGKPVHVPMTEAKADYWRAISQLKDAKEISADQLNFRRKIEQEISSVKSQEGKAA